MMTRKVLVLEDEENIRSCVVINLKRAGYEVVQAGSGEQALEKFHENPDVAVCILDVMLPRINGTDVCRTIRRSSDIPIMFLSARSEEIDRIIGLELGGDDYVTKPFSPREVALRVRKILSRTSAAPARPATQMLRYAELSVNPDTMEVFVGEQKLDMTAKEVHLLSYLIRNAQKVLNREQILKAVWGYDYYGDTRAVDAVVKRIRKKLPTENVHFSIQSIYGVGYRLGGQV